MKLLQTICLALLLSQCKTAQENPTNLKSLFADVRLEIFHAVHRLCKSLNTGRICANNRNSRASVAKQEEIFLLFLLRKVKKPVLCTDRTNFLFLIFSE